METFRQLVQMLPQNAVALVRLADAQVSQKDFDSAIETLRKAIAADPDQGQAWIALAKTYVLAGKAEDAIAEARRLEKERSDRALGYAIEGEVRATQKKWADAAAAYKAGLAREGLPMLAVRTYVALQNDGKQSEATALAGQWIKEHPKDVTMHMFLAAEKVNAEEALRIGLVDAVSLDPLETALEWAHGKLLESPLHRQR